MEHSVPKSKLYRRIERYALKYIQTLWDDPAPNCISAEFLLVGIMKVVEPEEDAMLRNFPEALRELAALRKVFAGRFAISRDALRSQLPKPTSADDALRRELEEDALESQDIQDCLHADSFLQTLVDTPTMQIAGILVRQAGEPDRFDGIRRILALANRKQELKRQLKERVIGQDHAVNALVEGAVDSMMMIDDPGRSGPQGIFLFMGPPGVGKTYLAEEGANLLNMPSMRFNMSEYTDQQEGPVKLIGLDKSYQSSHPGLLTSFVSQCEQNDEGCVLIFDEIEKACMSVIYLFLQILDTGLLRDNMTEETVSFRHAYLFFTTNAGRSLYENGDRLPGNVDKSVLLEALRNDRKPGSGAPFFPGEILSRMGTGCIVLFRHLSCGDLVKIGLKEMRRQGGFFRQEYGIDVAIDENLPFLVLLNAGGESDARRFRVACGDFIHENLFRLTNAVSEHRLVAALKKKNRIQFDADMESFNSALEQLTPLRRRDSFMIVSEDGEFRQMWADVLCGCSDASVHTPASYAQALMELQSGKCFPSAVLLELAGDLENPGETAKFADRTPLIASDYRGFVEFLTELTQTVPEVPIYVLLDMAQYNRTNVVETVLELGATEVLDAQQDMDVLLERLFALNQKRRLEQIAFQFARQRKGLRYTLSPTAGGSGVVIRMKNFQVITQVSGEDQKDMTSESRMPMVTFDDYIGADDIKAEMQEFIGFLRDPRGYTATHGTQPKGILLYGPPGTGKTFFAKALSHEANVPFFPANGSSFITQYEGSGPQAVRTLFAKARKYAPSIIFIDEIDAIGARRTGAGGQRSAEGTLNMLLSEVDGFGTDPVRPVFLVAATNYTIHQDSSMALDPALIRRFTRTFLVDLPNQQDRAEFLRRKLKASDTQISEAFLNAIARRSVGMNFGSLGNVVEQAARDARAAGGPITEPILDNALETILYGRKKQWGADALERTAWHEAGHAFLSCYYGHTPEYVTITARGSFGGYVIPASTEDKFSWTRQEILERVQTALAGRAAELLRFGPEDGLSTGPAQDIALAGSLLSDYVCRFAMDTRQGLFYVPNPDAPPPSACQRIQELMQEQADTALEILTRNRGKMERLTARLLEANKLMAAEIDALLSEGDG